MNNIVFMFSGQGSQYYHMGKELYEHHPIFRKWMDILDSTAYVLCGQSIIDHLYDETKKKSVLFNKTFYTHPAIFMVEYALAQVLLGMGIEPDYVLGTSIGEFTSAAIAHVMTFEEALLALIKQAEILESYCEEGGMLAILHDARIFHETPFIYRNSELVSVNFYSHFVISSKTDQLKHIEQYLRQNCINYQALPVTQAFHSSLIDPAEETYIDYLSQKSYKSPRIPFVSCTYANILEDFSNDYFWEVIRKPIEFQKTLHELEKKHKYIYLDLGPSGTLANFVKYNLDGISESRSLAVMSPFGQDLNNLRKIESFFNEYFSSKKCNV